MNVVCCKKKKKLIGPLQVNWRHMKNNIIYFMSTYRFRAMYQSPWSRCPWGENDSKNLMIKKRKI